MTTTSTRDNLCREVEFIRSDDDRDGSNDGFNLNGYGAVFGQSTEINSWEGTFEEEIRKGAFKKTLRERQPVMQFDHGRHPLIGSIPIASIRELREDDEGLYTEARMSDNWLIEPVRMAIAEGNIKGMSFRFDVVREKWFDNAGKELRDPMEIADLLWSPGDRGPLKRELIELRLHELGPVVFPAYTQTTVGVRAREVASLIRSNVDVRRKVQRGLATDATSILDALEQDEDLRRETASVVLWGAAAPVGQPEKVEPSAEDTRTDPADAPLPDEHPSTVTNPEDIGWLRDDIATILADIRANNKRIGESGGA
jgi:uncharacterized protein